MKLSELIGDYTDACSVECEGKNPDGLVDYAKLLEAVAEAAEKCEEAGGFDEYYIYDKPIIAALAAAREAGLL